MYDRILLALDAETAAASAVAAVADLACRSEARALVVHVRDLERGLCTGHEAEQLVDTTVERLRAFGVRARGQVRTIAGGDTSGALLQGAAWFGADLVVLGSKGRGELGGLLLGSVGQRVATGTDAAVMLVHTDPGRRSRRWPRPLGRILLAVDRGEGTDAAIRATLDLCRRHRAAATILHAHSISESPSYARRFAGSIADRFAGEGIDVRAESVASGRSGVPVRIADAAERAHADLIVIGSQRCGEPAAVVLGSMARALVRVTARPVLLADAIARDASRPVEVHSPVPSGGAVR